MTKEKEKATEMEAAAAPEKGPEIPPENLAAMKEAAGQVMPGPIIPPPEGGPTPPDEPTPAFETGILVKRAKLSRGNMRRITKARDDLDNAIVAFVKAMDPLVFEADETGAKIGPWPLLAEVQHMRDYITREIADLMTQQ